MEILKTFVQKIHWENPDGNRGKNSAKTNTKPWHKQAIISLSWFFWALALVGRGDFLGPSSIGSGRLEQTWSRRCDAFHTCMTAALYSFLGKCKERYSSPDWWESWLPLKVERKILALQLQLQERTFSNVSFTRLSAPDLRTQKFGCWREINKTSWPFLVGLFSIPGVWKCFTLEQSW